mmetsp:Transcript_916/g.708  ORF Transcript_916/g.708 Transcript_916/m.708 type:complete len:94 (+) Transcript_916:28-309(+)
MPLRSGSVAILAQVAIWARGFFVRQVRRDIHYLRSGSSTCEGHDARSRRQPSPAAGDGIHVHRDPAVPRQTVGLLHVLTAGLHLPLPLNQHDK